MKKRRVVVEFIPDISYEIAGDINSMSPEEIKTNLKKKSKEDIDPIAVENLDEADKNIIKALQVLD